MDKIILYTIGCPKCHQLERKLDSKHIPYTVCESIETMKGLGIYQAPVLGVNGELLDFTQAWKWATNYEVKNEN